MTVIAWDGQTLAADKMATSCGHASTTTKIRRASNGSLLAASGDADKARELFAWYEGGADPSAFPSNRDANNDPYCSVMVITPEKKIFKIERGPYLIEFEDKVMAMGCGRDYALATMHLGFDAVKAVEVASALDISCGKGIDMLTFEG